MPLVASREPEREFENPPADTHIGTCYRVLDLGTQQTPFKDEKTGALKRQHQVQLSWELDCLMTDGKPFSMHRRYTLSLHEKSALCKDLQAWRGKPFTEAELEAFDLSAILGTSCLIGVAHEQKEGGKVYAKISSILKLPKNTKAPALVNPRVCLILKPGEFNYDTFANLSDSMRDTIRQSPEYLECTKDQGGEPKPDEVDEAPDADPSQYGTSGHVEEGVKF